MPFFLQALWSQWSIAKVLENHSVGMSKIKIKALCSMTWASCPKWHTKKNLPTKSLTNIFCLEENSTHDSDAIHFHNYWKTWLTIALKNHMFMLWIVGISALPRTNLSISYLKLHKKYHQTWSIKAHFTVSSSHMNKF